MDVRSNAQSFSTLTTRRERSRARTLEVSLTLPLTFAASLLACTASEDSNEPILLAPPASSESASLTYYGNVKPIIDAKCTGCHYTGGIAPFPLADYETTAAYAAVIKPAVVDRIMPPWLADPQCNTYAHDLSLSDSEITTISNWVDLGAPAGDPRATVAPLEGGSARIDRIDATIAMPASYTPHPPPGELDEQRCFILDWPFASDKYVTGFEVRAGNAAVVHHVIASVVPQENTQALIDLDAADPEPGYACQQGAGLSQGAGGRRPTAGTSGESLFDQLQGAGMLAAWAPGGGANVIPAGSGILIRPSSKVLLNIHYNIASQGPGPDRTSVDFMLEDSVAKPGLMAFWTNPLWLRGTNMLIAAGDPNVSYGWSFDPTLVYSGHRPLTVYASGLHMHVRGTGGALSIERAGAGTECLIDLPRWDFHWQRAYELARPITVLPGDELRIDCHYDNSAANQPYVRGEKVAPIDVTWGEGTEDEMCLAFLYMTL